MLTRTDLKRYISFAQMTDREIKKGYCCHYEMTEEEKKNCVNLGYNAGIYGWNWTLYLTDKALYIDGYRNY